MTAPPVENPEVIMKEDLTLSEMEALDTPAPSPTEDVPEEFKGKSPADLAKLVASTREAVKISEEARLKAEMKAMVTSATPAPAAPAAPAPLPTDELDAITNEQLDEMIASEDPAERVKGTNLKIAKSNRVLVRAFETRMAGVNQSSASQAEINARGADPEAFELFGSEIQDLASRLPASQLASPQNWEMLIASVRGRKENIAKVIAHRATKDRDAAVEAERANAGFTPRTAAPTARVIGTIPQADDTGLDDVQKRIALLQFPNDDPRKSYAEYAKFARMG